MRISRRSPLDSASRGPILPNASQLLRFVPFTPHRHIRQARSLLRVGITPRAELRIEPGSYAKATSPNGTMSGREDGALGVKVRLHVPAAEGPSILPSVSVVLLSIVPSGSSVFRQN